MMAPMVAASEDTATASVSPAHHLDGEYRGIGE